MPTLTLQPSGGSGIETFIQQVAPTTNRGTFNYTQAGTDNSSNINRALIKFDLSSWNPSWIFVSAELDLAWGIELNTTDRSFTAHRALTNWTELGATWNTYNGSNAWVGGSGGAAGSDWITTATDSITVTTPAQYQFDVTLDVRGFISGDYSNYGWFILGEEGVASTYKGFYTSDTTGSWPILRIEYLESAVEITTNDGTGKDAYINQSTPNNNWGAATTINIGNDSGGSDRVGFLKFDLDAIPDNATIVDAILQLTVDGVQNTNQILDFYRLLVDWTEGVVAGSGGDVSWNERQSGVAWNTAGARGSGTDRESVASFTEAVTNYIPLYQTNLDATADVQAWFSGTPNYGWAIDFSYVATTTNTQITFRSNDYLDSNSHPRLIVSYIIQNTEGSADGSSTATGLLFADGNLEGSADGQATVSATLESNEFISALAEGDSTVSGTMFGTGYVSGLSQGSADGDGDLVAEILIPPGLSEGEATVSGDIKGVYYMIGESNGSSTAVGTGSFQGQLRGSADGTTDVEATGYARAVAVTALQNCYPLPLFYITNGSYKNNGQKNLLDLISEKYGYRLNNWDPSVIQFKDGGRWANSPMAQGRRLKGYVFDNAVEILDLNLVSKDQNRAIQFLHDLWEFQQAAADYWSSAWASLPVYLVGRAAKETNTWYAVVHQISCPQLKNLFAQPFFDDTQAAFDTLTLRIERGHWTSSPPGDYEQVQISSIRSWTVAGWQSGS